MSRLRRGRAFAAAKGNRSLRRVFVSRDKAISEYRTDQRDGLGERGLCQCEGMRKRLQVLSKRSKSPRAADAIASDVESEEWQLEELQAGIEDLDSGRDVGHEKVSKWLKSWGKRGTTKAPR